MSKKMLLREYYELCEGGACQDLLTEAEKKFVANGGLMLSGRFQSAGVKNGNGRMYSRPILEREVENYGKIEIDNMNIEILIFPDKKPVLQLTNIRGAAGRSGIKMFMSEVMKFMHYINAHYSILISIWLAPRLSFIKVLSIPVHIHPINTYYGI